uniref:Uncharacterized protein n=1 Tax=Eptatretus burgeri TaxID=7764 RepID=A0A8C4WYA5_EPTBU
MFCLQPNCGGFLFEYEAFCRPKQREVERISDEGRVMVTISNKTANPTDLGTVAYYVEKQFKSKKKLEDFDEDMFDLGKREAYVWYYDDEPPTMSMERITPGIIAIVVVVILALIACIIVSVLVYKQSMKNRKENPYAVSNFYLYLFTITAKCHT